MSVVLSICFFCFALLCVCVFVCVCVCVRARLRACVGHGAVRIRVSRQCCDTIWAEAHKAVATHHTPDVSHAHTHTQTHTQSHRQGFMLYSLGKKMYGSSHSDSSTSAVGCYKYILYCPHPVYMYTLFLGMCWCTHIESFLYIDVFSNLFFRVVKTRRLKWVLILSGSP